MYDVGIRTHTLPYTVIQKGWKEERGNKHFWGGKYVRHPSSDTHMNTDTVPSMNMSNLILIVEISLGVKIEPLARFLHFKNKLDHWDHTNL
jgi:hypothetical protein